MLSVVLLIAVWEGASRSFPSVILPSPGETLRALDWLLHRDSFYDHTRETLTRSITGFSLSMLLGTVLGLLTGRFRVVYWLLNPLIAISTTVPPIFWVTILIIGMGLGSGPPIWVIIITATPLVTVNIAQGMHSISPQLVEMADIFRVSMWTRLRRLYLPAISGHIFAAALIAVRFSWRTVVMAEFIGSTSGLGNRLSWSRQNLETDLTFAYMVIMVFFGLMLEYGILRPAQQRWGWSPNENSRPVARSVPALVKPEIAQREQSAWLR